MPGVAVSFHVRSIKVPAFLRAIATLQEEMQAEKGLLECAVHTELRSAIATSSQEVSLIVMQQRWASNEALTAHTTGAAAVKFNRLILGEKLVCAEPGIVLLSEPRTPAEMRKVAAELDAEIEAATKESAAMEGATAAGAAASADAPEGAGEATLSQTLPASAPKRRSVADAGTAASRARSAERTSRTLERQKSSERKAGRTGLGSAGATILGG